MKAAIYVRVSTKKQDINNQLIPLRDLAKAYKYDIIKEYKDVVSGGDSNRPQFQQMLKDVRLRKFEIILIWALDRFSREGILNTLSYLKTLKKHNIYLKSLKESWLDTSDEGMSELIIAIFSWAGAQEVKRLSERIKAGLKKAGDKGKRGKDRGKRKTSGYYRRWAK